MSNRCLLCTIGSQKTKAKQTGPVYCSTSATMLFFVFLNLNLIFPGQPAPSSDVGEIWGPKQCLFWLTTRPLPAWHLWPLYILAHKQHLLVSFLAACDDVREAKVAKVVADIWAECVSCDLKLKTNITGLWIICLRPLLILQCHQMLTFHQQWCVLAAHTHSANIKQTPSTAR